MKKTIAGYELKNLKIYESMSEETTCFSATLYLDGKKVGELANRGCGGAHEVHLDKFERDALEAVANEHYGSVFGIDELIDDLTEIDAILWRFDQEAEG